MVPDKIDGIKLDEVDLSNVDLNKLDPCNPEDYINWWAMCKQFKIDPDDPVHWSYYYIQKLYLDAGAVNVSRESTEKMIFRKIPTPVFSIVEGSPVKLETLPMVSMKDLYSEPQTAHLSDLMIRHKKKKEKLPLFSFCVSGKVYACVLDIENGTPLFKVLEALKNFSYFAYFSASSELEKQRFRVVIPLSEPIDSDVYSYCKDRLHKAFGEIADRHTFEPTRFFFMPSELTGSFQEENILYSNEGSSLDFMKTTGFNAADKLQMYAKQFKKNEADYRDVSEDERIEYYLSTDFPLMKGNGDSASSLYTAICVCLAHGDEETLDRVLDKARSENWSEKELKRNISQAKKFLKL